MMITLTLDDAEASAVAVALVGLIHDPTSTRWHPAAVEVAERLRMARYGR